MKAIVSAQDTHATADQPQAVVRHASEPGPQPRLRLGGVHHALLVGVALGKARRRLKRQVGVPLSHPGIQRLLKRLHPCALTAAEDIAVGS
jgi:hypothetical protein